MFQAWIFFEKQIDRFLEKNKRLKELGASNFLFQRYQKEIEEFFFLEKRIKEVAKLLYEQFGISEIKLKGIVLPNSHLFKLSNREIISRFRYYIKLFGSLNLLCQVIKNSSLFFSSDNLFSWKEKENAEKVLNWLQIFFNLSENQARLLAIHNTYFFVKDSKRLEYKINKFSELLNVDVETIKKMCLLFPSCFYSSTFKRLKEKIDGFSKIFQVEIDKTREVFVKYPYMIDNQIATYLTYYRILKKHTANVSQYMIKHPYIIKFIDFNNKKCCNAFENFDQLVDILTYIVDNIGLIISAHWYSHLGKDYHFCVVKKTNGEIVCVLLNANEKIININKQNIYWYNKRAMPYFKFKSYSENYVHFQINQILKTNFNVQ